MIESLNSLNRLKIKFLKFPVKKGCVRNNTLPIVSPPIIHSLSVDERTRIRNDKIIEENIKNESNRTVETRTKYNSKQLKRADVQDEDIDKYLTYDGHVTKEGKELLKQKNISFKGTENEDNNLIKISDFPENPSIEEINSIDISMPEELENFLDAPLPEIDSELMSNIMDAIPDGFEVDEGILSTFKSLLETVTDI